MLTCDVAQRSLSALADGEPPDAPGDDVSAHVTGCAECQAFEASMREIRRLLRLEPVDEAVDLAPRVLARLPASAPPRRRPWVPAVAAAVAGAVVGATFVGIGRSPDQVAAEDLPRRVVAEQPAVTTLAAAITVNEPGDRTWTGTLRYRAPESLAVVLHDEAGNLLATVADGDQWWVAGPRRCVPVKVNPCAEATRRAVDGRAPFADDTPVPLELVAPVGSLALAGTLEHLPGGADGTVGVRVTAGQVVGLLDGLDPTDALRPVHPSDPVDLWLDDGTLVPVEVVVRAAGSPERARWAAGQGLADTAGDVVLTVALDDVVVDEALPAGSFPAPPAGTDERAGGFVADADPAGVPAPADLPPAMQAGRAGRVDGVGVRTWSDGRAWLAVRSSRTWPGGQLFGDLGPFVVPVDLGGGSVGYRSADGTRFALHGDDIDVVVAGSVATDVLRQAAASLGVIGRSVPADWDEAATATLADAEAAAPDLLVPSGLDGFTGPAVRLEGGDVSLRYTGPGERAFVVVRAAAAQLGPALDRDVIPITVRGQPGRWVAASGDLEWVEDGHARAVRAPTLPLAEVLALAEDLRSV